MVRERDILHEAADITFARLDAVQQQIDQLSEPQRTFVIVYSAQSIIDNGGLEFFYSSDFPNNPPYQQFIAAYQRIGARDAALAIEQSLVFFCVDHPERDLATRRAFIDSLPEDDAHPFSRLSLQVCGDERVWACLEAYVRQQLPAFGLVPLH